MPYYCLTPARVERAPRLASPSGGVVRPAPERWSRKWGAKDALRNNLIRVAHCVVMKRAMQTLPTAADLRSLIARHRLQLYRLAPLVDLHPSRLSLVLNARVPLPRDLAETLLHAIE